VRGGEGGGRRGVGDDGRGQGPDVTITDSAANGVAVDRTEAFTAMVVDDHPLLRESMVARLRAMGATEVLEAASLAEARARANVSGPRDLCILDLAPPAPHRLALPSHLPPPPLPPP